MRRSLRLLLDLVDEAFDRKAWHGTTLLGSIRGVKSDLAAWRPRPRRHNIWELTLHAAYWKYTVRRSLSGEKRGSFALAGSNWFPRPAAGARRDGSTWPQEIRLLVGEHRRMRDAIAALPERVLDRRIQGRDCTAAYLIRGIAAHDLYHAGQIQLIKRLHESR